MDSTPSPRLAQIAALIVAAASLSCVESRPRNAPLPLPPPGRGSPGPAEPSDLVERVVEAHNAERDRRRLPPLKLNPRLEAAAVAHARDMAGRRKMAHKGGDGSSPFDRIRREGYDFRAAGENVAYGFDDVESVMGGWMRSPGHRRNILGDYAEIGVGRATGGDGASYWCVTFGTPGGG